MARTMEEVDIKFDLILIEFNPTSHIRVVTIRVDSAGLDYTD